MPGKKQIEYRLTLRLWDLKRHTSPEWHEQEIERIAAMIADGYTSGEIIGARDESGWWDLEKTETQAKRRAPVHTASRLNG